MIRAFDSLATTLDRQPPEGDSLLEQAHRLMASPAARQAFDLAAEPSTVRERYGMRRLGQSCLLARRLIEADVPFVTALVPEVDLAGRRVVVADRPGLLTPLEDGD